MEHIVQFGITIDDSAIKQRVESQALDQIVKSFTAELKAHLPKKYGDIDWSRVAYEAVNEFIQENKDEIISEMKQTLIDRVKRTKAYQDAVVEIVEKAKQ